MYRKLKRAMLVASEGNYSHYLAVVVNIKKWALKKDCLTKDNPGLFVYDLNLLNFKYLQGKWSFGITSRVS